ncbi:MAG TPA: hypothetical protein PKK31_06930 [Elusimicrobiales bacterium]|nr:hypothetical protein [Elusimicrobiales bacterium]
MNRKEVLAAIAASGLPPRLAAYLGQFIAQGTASELRKALKADPARRLGNIKALLDSSAAALALPAEGILSITGFDYNNFAPDRLEAALAELRAVNILARRGFTEIRFLPGGQRREADISAVLAGEKYFFEVHCLKNRDAFSGADEKKERRLKDLCRKKLGQAHASGRRERSARAGVFLVADPAGAVSPMTDGALTDLASRMHASMGSPAGEHICLSAGGESAIFPSF